MSDAAAALPAGATFHGRYRILRCINAGGMGAVYECVHLKTGKHRALKVMLPQIIAHPGMRDRFELEARATAEIDSDHIVETFDAGIDDTTGAPFLVMELLRGKDLEKILREGGPLSAEHTVYLLSQAALGLDKTHDANIVHRDLKPQNLFVVTRDDGSPRLKLLDFGIAKVVAEHDKTAAHTATIGTPVYMSPEQILGQGNLGPRADLYAMGHIAFTLLVGEAYWEEDWREAGSPFVLWSKMMGGVKEPASARAARHGVALPPAFDAWFLTATAHAAQSRFDRGSSLVAALAQVLGVTSVSPQAIAELAARTKVDPAPRGSGTEIITGATPRPNGTPDPRALGQTPAQVAPSGHVSRPVATQQTASPVSRDTAAPAKRSLRPVVTGMVVLAALLGAGARAAIYMREQPQPAPAVQPESPDKATATATAGPPPAVTASAQATPQPSVAVTAPPTEPIPPAAPAAPAASTSSGLAKGALVKKAPPVSPVVAPPVAPPAPVQRVVNCNPPYEIDASGIRTRKPECR